MFLMRAGSNAPAQREARPRDQKPNRHKSRRVQIGYLRGDGWKATNTRQGLVDEYNNSVDRHKHVYLFIIDILRTEPERTRPMCGCRGAPYSGRLLRLAVAYRDGYSEPHPRSTFALNKDKNILYIACISPLMYAWRNFLLFFCKK
jgi:hypothetical protein